jgi:WG containing repeat
MPLFVFKAGTKFGLFDEAREVVLPPSFKWLYRSRGGIVAGSVSDETAILIDFGSQEKKLLQGIQDIGPYSPAGLISIRDCNKLIGFIDCKGVVKIEPQFEWASDFDRFGATIKRNATDKCLRRINTDGVEVGEEWLSIVPFHPLGNGSGAHVDWGGINMVAIDAYGNRRTKECYKQVWRKHEGLTPVAIDDEWVGFLDEDDRLADKFEGSFIGNHFQEGHVPVEINGEKWGLMHKDRSWVLDPVYDVIEGIGEGMYMVGHRDERENPVVRLADSQGNIISDRYFNEIGFFDEGWAETTTYHYLPDREDPDFKTAYINREGVELVPPNVELAPPNEV